MTEWDRRSVEALLVAGTSPNVADSSGATPLHFAVRSNVAETVAALLLAGADAKATNNSGTTPLHYAVNYGRAAVKVLLDAGADPNAADAHGMTPLHVACLDETTVVTDLLLAGGANAAAVDSCGCTAMDYAVFWNCMDAYCALLAVGAPTGNAALAWWWHSDRVTMDADRRWRVRSGWLRCIFTH